jgi:hypothetical protein
LCRFNGRGNPIPGLARSVSNGAEITDVKKPAQRIAFSDRNSGGNHVPGSFNEPGAAVTNYQQLRRLLSSP